jgi:8-oxo-dGTP diphosphatase
MNTPTDRKSRPQVVLVTRALVRNDEGNILLIQRSKIDSYEPSKWELPGGKLDMGQNISDAMEREVLEETGLVVIPTERLSYWNSSMITSGKYKGLPYIVLVGIAKSIGGEVSLSNEHDAYVWVSMDKAFEYDLVSETRVALKVLSKKLL